MDKIIRLISKIMGTIIALMINVMLITLIICIIFESTKKYLLYEFIFTVVTFLVSIVGILILTIIEKYIIYWRD